MSTRSRAARSRLLRGLAPAAVSTPLDPRTSGGGVSLLSVLTTNQKGLLAETAIIHECVKRGIGVARPLDDAPYDLILDLGPKLIRVQCKWAVRRGGVVVIRTRRCRRGRVGHIHRSYGAHEIDAIAAYCPDTGD